MNRESECVYCGIELYGMKSCSDINACEERIEEQAEEAKIDNWTTGSGYDELYETDCGIELYEKGRVMKRKEIIKVIKTELRRVGARGVR